MGQLANRGDLHVFGGRRGIVSTFFPHRTEYPTAEAVCEKVCKAAARILMVSLMHAASVCMGLREPLTVGGLEKT